MNNVLACQRLSKSYEEAGGQLQVLKEVNFEIKANQSIAIIGTSGSGKSTLLHLLGGLDEPSMGEVFWNGDNIRLLSEKQKCLFRNRHLGFIYQFHHLMPEFTALENVAMSLLLGGISAMTATRRAKDYLKKVGLADRMHHKVGELSGGERQRAAIARAMVAEPKCVLADEPTGNLDRHTADTVLEVMLNLQKESGTSFVVVTHDLMLAKRMQICYSLEEGRLSLG